ncbi:MAG: methyltransferase [Desulfurococcaceae archaeon]
MITSKADLERALTPYSLEAVRKQYKAHLEQYPTSTSVAAHMIWVALLKNSIDDATVADLGCGNGILATASLLAGSRRAVCVDIDEEILAFAQSILFKGFREMAHQLIPVVSDAASIELNNIDTVVMNPPFGVVKRNRGLDLKFLKSALRSARNVYSLHKHSRGFLEVLEEMSKAMELDITWFEVLNLEIPMIYSRHRRRVHRVKVVLLGLTKRYG